MVLKGPFLYCIANSLLKNRQNVTRRQINDKRKKFSFSVFNNNEGWSTSTLRSYPSTVLATICIHRACSCGTALSMESFETISLEHRACFPPKHPVFQPHELLLSCIRTTHLKVSMRSLLPGMPFPLYHPGDIKPNL